MEVYLRIVGQRCAIAWVLTFGVSFWRDDLYPLAERWADYGMDLTETCNCEAKAWGAIVSVKVDIWPNVLLRNAAICLKMLRFQKRDGEERNFR